MGGVWAQWEPQKASEEMVMGHSPNPAFTVWHTKQAAAGW